MKIFAFIGIIAISIAGSYLGKNTISNDQDALNLIVNFFSIFTGILVALISIIGDPADILDSDNWRSAFYKKNKSTNELIRICFLFYCYFITLFFIFASFFIDEKNFNFIKSAIEYMYTFFACFSILLSFNLPIMLVKYQKSKLNKAVKYKRKNTNIDN